jgi:hypothetical protein
VRPSLVPSLRPRAVGRLLAVLAAFGITSTAVVAPSAARADGPPWTAAAPDDQRPQIPPNPRVVIPTDTVVSPPAAGFVPEDRGYVPGYATQRIVGPNVAWGWVSWDGIRAGAASGVHVTLISRQTGWRFSTVTDTFGRYRLALPDGNYDTLLEDPRLPYGAVTRGDTPYSGGDMAWNGGMSVGMGLVMYPRPLNSCRLYSYLVLDGVDGWAPGHDDTNTPCVATAAAVPESTMDADTVEWAVTGKDRVPVAPAPIAKPVAPTRSTATAVRPPSTAAAGTPRLARTVRLRPAGATVARVRCPTATTCAGRLSVLASAGCGRALASGELRAGARTVRLRPTVAGRRALRRGAVRARVVWTPTGGTSTVAAGVVLRSAGH